jgi:hypothetical protein
VLLFSADRLDESAFCLVNVFLEGPAIKAFEIKNGLIREVEILII